MAVSRRFLVLCAVSFLLCAMGLLGVILNWPNDVSVERISFPGPYGRIEARLWTPKENKVPTLAILICHGVQTNKEAMDTIAIESARRGAVAITFDYGGYGESERHDDELEKMVQDSAAALELLKSKYPALKVVAIGHSMGATYAVELARRHPEIEAVVAMGNEPVSPDVPPKNVMFAMGVYDVFHSVNEMLDTTRQSAENPLLKPNQLSGNFQNGSARKMSTSPLTDHGPEPVDSQLLLSSFDWFSQAVPNTLTPIDSVADVKRVQFHTVAALSFGVFVAALVVLSSQKKWSLLSRAHVIVFFCTVAISFFFTSFKAPLFTDVAMISLLAGMFAQGILRLEPELSVQWNLFRDSFFVLTLFSFCMLLGVLIIGFPGAMALNYVTEIPRSILSIVLVRPFEGLCVLRAYAFGSWSLGLFPSTLTVLLVSIELVRPGLIFKILISGISGFLSRLHFGGGFSFSAGSTRTTLFAIGVFSLLAFVLFKRFQEGWLESGALSRMASIGFRGLVIPFVIFAVAINLAFRVRNKPA
jgi:alpha/beta superfamily hydrolase